MVDKIKKGNLEDDNNTQITSISKKQKMSKFDIVKVRVYLGEHWFVFSRYILSSMLQVVCISDRDSNKIAFALKKRLVEEGLLNVQLKEFQELLFELMKDFGYNSIYKERYLMMNKFYSNRVPLVILIAGSISVGKSTIANKLSERINISNVLQTKIVNFVMAGLNPDYNFKPFWLKNSLNKKESATNNIKSSISNKHLKEEIQKEYDINLNNKIYSGVISSYLEECKHIRKGCNLDMIKAFKEGKPVILEGHHIVPSMFIKKNEKEMLVLTTPINEFETSHEKSMREEIEKMEIPGLIVPFLVKINEESHKEIIWNNCMIEDSDKYEATLAFREVQNYLINENNYFFEIESKNDNLDEVIDSMHNQILAQIEKFYKERLF